MNLRESVKRYYGERISKGEGCCDPSPAALAPSFGCGEPTKFAELKPGERVLDLGSGAGLDCFRAAKAVGNKGYVIGVDMTPEMLKRAKQGAQKLSLHNVEFREGFIEDLPVAAASIDVVISNCVINLSTEKPKVFSEIHRILKPGGHLIVSDILRNGPGLTVIQEAAWCACEDGAEPAETYKQHLQTAGFAAISIDPAAPEVMAGDTYSALIHAAKP